MNITINETARLFPDFIDVSKVRQASFSEIHNNELSNYFNSDLGYIIRQDRDYTLFAIPKNALNSEYEIFLNCFPTFKKNIVHTIDEFDEYWKNEFFDGIEIASNSIQKTTEERKEKLAKLYSVQHVGPNELNDYQFSTTYDQIHWHIYGVTGETLARCTQQKFPIETSRYQKNTFHDPFTVLYFDLMKECFPCLEVDNYTSSLILGKTHLSFKIDSFTRAKVRDSIVFWKRTWRELASCLTNFSTSPNGRLIPLDQRTRLFNINKFIESNSHLSRKSRRLLILLARHLRETPYLEDPNQKNYWNTIHNNINGSIGITHDFENETTTLRLAPRILAVRERVGATDGNYLCLKDKSQFLPLEERKRMIAIQKSLIRRLRDLNVERDVREKLPDTPPVHNAVKRGTI